MQRLLHRPYGVVGFGQAYGFITGYLNRMPQVQDPALIRYIRRQQMRRLVGLNSIWK